MSLLSLLGYPERFDQDEGFVPSKRISISVQRLCKYTFVENKVKKKNGNRGEMVSGCQWNMCGQLR